LWVIVHTYVGIAIASVLHLPFWLVALIVLASHVLLDLIPHWDYTASRDRMLWGWFDFLGALATLIVLLVLGMPFALVVMGPISGAPDFDVLANTMWGREDRRLFPSHWRRFPHGRCGPALGVPLQLAIMAASAAVFLTVGLSR
jgi:hypothetical protein